MRNQPFLPAIVRMSALALMVGVAACSDGMMTAPEAVDDIMVVTASAKNGKGVGATNTVFEPQRYRQVRIYESGGLTEFGRTNTEPVYRICQLNSFEDMDGNDYVHVDRTDGYRKERINEKDGFIMIQELSGGVTRTTHIGRSTWNAQFWFDDAERGIQTFVESLGQGVVFPVDYEADGTASDPLVAELLFWFDGTLDDEPGSWSLVDGQLVPAEGRPGVDLLNHPLGLIGPNRDFVTEGSVGEAVIRINELLARYEDDLLGAECDANYDFLGFIDGDPTNTAASNLSYFIHDNTITLSKTWPKRRKGLF